MKFNGHKNRRDEKVRLHCVVQVGVLVEEPEHAVVGLGVDALLLEQGHLVVLTRQEVELEHLQEGVSILGCELDGEVQIILGVFEVAVAVLSVVCHRDTGSLAPDLSRFGDLT